MINSRPIRYAAILVAVSTLLARATPGSGLLFGQPKAVYAARREKARAQVAGAIELLFSPGDNGDVGLVRYRTTSNFMYLTGVESPGAVLALRPAGAPSGKRE